MVKHVAVVVVALARSAVAEPAQIAVDTPPSELAPYTRLGTRIGIARLPAQSLSYSLGLSLSTITSATTCVASSNTSTHGTGRSTAPRSGSLDCRRVGIASSSVYGITSSCMG